MHDIELKCENSFIKFWTSKLKIWKDKSNLQNPYYSKEQLQKLYNIFVNYPKKQEFYLFNENGENIQDYFMGINNKWEHIEELPIKLAVTIPDNEMNCQYFLGEYLVVAPQNLINKTFNKTQWMELCMSTYEKYPEPENTSSGDGWYFIRLVQTEPNIYKITDADGQYL